MRVRDEDLNLIVHMGLGDFTTRSAGTFGVYRIGDLAARVAGIHVAQLSLGATGREE